MVVVVLLLLLWIWLIGRNRGSPGQDAESAALLPARSVPLGAASGSIATADVDGELDTNNKKKWDMGRFARKHRTVLLVLSILILASVALLLLEQPLHGGHAVGSPTGVVSGNPTGEGGVSDGASGLNENDAKKGKKKKNKGFQLGDRVWVASQQDTGILTSYGKQDGHWVVTFESDEAVMEVPQFLENGEENVKPYMTKRQRIMRKRLKSLLQVRAATTSLSLAPDSKSAAPPIPNIVVAAAASAIVLDC